MASLNTLKVFSRRYVLSQISGKLAFRHSVRWCADKRQVDVTSSKQTFVFDTLALSENLQQAGFTPSQAKCIVGAFVQITSAQMDFINKNMITKPQQEILLQQILAQIASVKKDMVILEKSEFSSLKHEYEQQNSEIQEVRRHFQDELLKIKAGVQLDLNLEKSRAKDAHAENEKILSKLSNRIDIISTEHDKHISGLDSKIGKEIAQLLATYERYRNDVMKYSAGAVMTCLTICLGFYRLWSH
jgi:uncharacterized protein YqcC (DUF446 family)